MNYSKNTGRTVESKSHIRRIISGLEKLEDGILVFLLLTMITLAVLQIVLRNLLDSGLIWGDALVRVLVLWIGLIGAMAASRKDNHISIDVISRFFPGMAKSLTHLFTAGISGLMAWHSARFVLMERADQITAFAGVPAWVCESIIPVAFTVICLRYVLFFIICFAGKRQA